MTDVASLIERTYQLWLSHAPTLYDFCTTHVLEWPSNTVSFLPDSRRHPPCRDYSLAQLVVGTTTPGINHLKLYHVFLPADRDVEEFFEDDFEAFKQYSGHYHDVAALAQPSCTLIHDGPVVKAAPMPSMPRVIATRGHHNFAYLFDISRRRAAPLPGDRAFRPDARLRGPRREGYGMAWSELQPGFIALASADHNVYVYDISTSEVEALGTRSCVDISPVAELKGHTDMVEDVTWHPAHQDVLGTVGYDNALRLWDTRGGTKPQQSEIVHRDAVHSVAFHPNAVFMVATASADRSVRLWDIRKFQGPVAELVGHTDAVYGVKWSPFNDTVALSYGSDRSVICWDIGKYETKRLEGQDDNAKPELVFRHLGHTSHVREASWCPFREDEWVVASVDDNNMLQVWSPHPDVYNDEVDADTYATEVF